MINPLLLVTFFPLVGFLIIALLKSGAKSGHPLGGAGHLAGHLWHLAVDAGAVQPSRPGPADDDSTCPGLPAGPGLQIGLGMGVDGLSLMMVLLTTLLTPHCDPLHLGCRPGAGEGLYALLPAARNGHAGRFPGHRPGAVLHLLGIHPGPDVLPDRHVGR